MRLSSRILGPHWPSEMCMRPNYRLIQTFVGWHIVEVFAHPLCDHPRMCVMFPYCCARWELSLYCWFHRRPCLHTTLAWWKAVLRLPRSIFGALHIKSTGTWADLVRWCCLQGCVHVTDQQPAYHCRRVVCGRANALNLASWITDPCFLIIHRLGGDRARKYVPFIGGKEDDWSCIDLNDPVLLLVAVWGKWFAGQTNVCTSIAKRGGSACISPTSAVSNHGGAQG